MHSGASDLIPMESRRSEEDPIVGATAGAAGALSIFTSTGLLGAITGAAATARAFGGAVATDSSFAISRYSPPLSSAAARYAAV